MSDNEGHSLNMDLFSNGDPGVNDDATDVRLPGSGNDGTRILIPIASYRPSRGAPFSGKTDDMKDIEATLRTEMGRLIGQKSEIEAQIFRIGDMLAFYDPTAVVPGDPELNVPIRIVPIHQAHPPLTKAFVPRAVPTYSSAEDIETRPVASASDSEAPIPAFMRDRRDSSVYTPERVALMMDNLELDSRTLLRMVNKLPGKTIKVHTSITAWLKKNGVKRTPNGVPGAKRFSPKYTVERVNLIREMFPFYSTPSIWRTANKLPGPKIESPAALQMFANGKLGLNRRQLAEETEANGTSA